ncbi:hypothetical protein HUG17_1328 [Dermatophagoides farinae]|uniref:Uncharacterized protein n=1 Tax=Dermatophagoides farinae TaxID=6954 RepID=A0A9D4SLS1_DERFA|nr:hypothetical protein HUG17_1328 [Dermatophagoides farinae]
MNENRSFCSSHVGIMNVSDLEKNCLYLNTNIEFNYEENSKKELLPSGCKFKKVLHSIALRLLHIFGPYDNNGYKELFLIAECICKPENNVLICIKNFDHQDFQFNVTFDHMNHVFSLKNFLTLDCPFNFSFKDLNEINCQISSKKLYNIVIIVSTEFHSSLIFHGNYGENITDLERLSQNMIEPMNLTVKHTSMMMESQQSKTSIYLPSDDDMETPMMNGKIMDIYADTQSLQANTVIESQLMSETELDDDYIGHKNDTEKKIKTILDEISSDLKEKFNLYRLLRTNLNDHLIQNEPIELTSLSQLQYPINSVQQYRFVNITGIIKQHNPQHNLLCICDDTIDNFEIKTDNKGIDYYKSLSSAQTSVINNNPKNYPLLKAGDIICIRQLCLKMDRKNICVHPDQIVIIEMHKEDDRITTNDSRKISIEELKRITELYCHHIIELLSCKTRSAKNMDGNEYFLANLVGLSAAKFASNISEKPYTNIFLMTPTKTNYPTLINENLSFITEQIENMSFYQYRFHYNESYLQNLKNNNQIISVSLWGIHKKISDTVFPLDVVILYNVLIRNDRSHSGFYYYSLSDGFMFGRRFIHVKSNTILSDYLQRLFLSFKEKIPMNIAPEEENNLAIQIETNLDTSILSRLGPNAKQFIMSMKDSMKMMGKKEELWKLANIKKNIFCHVKNHRTLFKSQVNVDIAKKIDSFADLMPSSDMDSEQQEVAKIFRISARLIDYQFEDKHGIEFYNMAHLRQSQIKIVCTSQSCDFTAPFMSFILQKTYDCMAISKDSCIDNTTLICQNCREPLAAYLSIEFYLEDEYGNHLTAIMSSPEIEELIQCTNKQLICTDPHKADNFNFQNYPNVYNRQLIDLNSNLNVNEFPIFYIRSIIIYE